MKLLYKVNDLPPTGVTLLLAIQHMLASIGGIVTVPLIVGGALGLPPDEIVVLISASLFVSGVATIVQCIGFGPVGIRLPVVMGTSFAFPGACIAIGMEGGMAAIMGAAFVGSFMVIIASFYMDFIRKLFPPLVSGVVVTLIGLTILPVAMGWIGDAPAGHPDFASLPKVFLSVVSLMVVIGVTLFCKGAVSASAIAISLAVGYVLAYFMGMVDMNQITQAAWFSAPEPFKYGMTFSFSAIISLALVYIVIVAEATGDFMALGSNCHEPISGKDLKRGLLGDGLGSTFSAMFTALPVASFSQNVGIVGISGVASRYVVAVTGALLILGGLFPKFAALAVTVPKPVLGGVGFVMFGMIAYAGIRMLVKTADSRRNAIIICVGLSSGLAVTFEPNLLQHFPEQLKMLLHSGITTGTLVTVVLNALLPRSKKAKLQQDESEIMTATSMLSKLEK
ncbi:purine permease [Shewanella sp. D64]|uniref:nucleobase:cation symporter-2 family protein n=1 Tax=unclassified Shewanella TaxID=196818 RepID=UPI0022BA691B|nr:MULTISPECIES: nucleobase:cation symporter-2 family protein [unclassified Shewanella]MEC4728706.1 purine permease [Shewanella sp. D64]MEC4740644.1 purine permease [Shewanella sp. E94]WBJ94466.1 purine permease [Shewanella sp. MTB7]